MTDPEATQPPRKPRTIRSAIQWLMAWCEANPVATAAILGVLVALPVVARLVW